MITLAHPLENHINTEYKKKVDGLYTEMNTIEVKRALTPLEHGLFSSKVSWNEVEPNGFQRKKLGGMMLADGKRFGLPQSLIEELRKKGIGHILTRLPPLKDAKKENPKDYWLVTAGGKPVFDGGNKIYLNMVKTKDGFKLNATG